MASNASRYFFLFLIGLVMGAVLAVMGLRALQARQDPFPDSVMHVMAKHSGLLAKTIDENRCAATDSTPHLRTLRAMTNDLELAFPGLADDQRFRTHASDFRAKLDAGLATPPTDCASATKINASIKDSCKACHQDFRG
jgi:cytochrome c556